VTQERAGDGLPPEVRELLICPRCHQALREEVEGFACERGHLYPVKGSVPILINEDNSLFSHVEFLAARETTLLSESSAERIAKRLVPQLGSNLRARANYQRFVQLLLEQTHDPRVLVIGGSILGRGIEPLVTEPRVHLIDTDVSLAGRTRIICDAHDLPFADASMDGVVAQAVLEHVVDPARCVSEMHRVLKPTGLVYAEIPFMQQVHGGRYDFMRFTPLGQRRLFRNFGQISAGAVAGPGTVLAWSYYYFLRGFAKTERGRNLAALVARATGFWLKYFDRVIIDRVGAQDGPSCWYFLGRKQMTALSDRELINEYRGLG
jgi:SAM-dependent methyltransferase